MREKESALSDASGRGQCGVDASNESGTWLQTVTRLTSGESRLRQSGYNDHCLLPGDGEFMEWSMIVIKAVGESKFMILNGRLYRTPAYRHGSHCWTIKSLCVENNENPI